MARKSLARGLFHAHVARLRTPPNARTRGGVPGARPRRRRAFKKRGPHLGWCRWLKMRSPSSWLPGTSPAALTLVLLALLIWTPGAQPAKRLDCKAFCRLTGFRFNAGACKCGYMLFTGKRASPPLSPNLSNGERGGPFRYPTSGRLALEASLARTAPQVTSNLRTPASDAAAEAAEAAAVLLAPRPESGPDSEDSLYR